MTKKNWLEICERETISKHFFFKNIRRLGNNLFSKAIHLPTGNEQNIYIKKTKKKKKGPNN